MSVHRKREITPQVQRAIDGLLACGLKRSEFSVQVERRWNRYGKYYELGDAQIHIRNEARGLELADRIADRFVVTRTTYTGRYGTHQYIFVEDVYGKHGLRDRYANKSWVCDYASNASDHELCNWADGECICNCHKH